MSKKTRVTRYNIWIGPTGQRKVSVCRRDPYSRRTYNVRAGSPSEDRLHQLVQTAQGHGELGVWVKDGRIDLELYNWS